MRCLILLTVAAFSVHAQQSIRLALGSGIEMELVRVEPGKFNQGESPATLREVTLTNPFFIGKFPVTRGQFARFVAATNYRTEAERGVSGGFGWEAGKLVQKKQYTWRTPGFPQTDEHPVVMVDFSDAKAFCTWLARQSGRPVALPTEAQWEYAASAGGKPGEAWHAGNSPGGTQPVGQKAANGFGVHDMLGNAWEWCEDWFAPYPAGAASDPLQTNQSLSDKPRRVLRGGAFSKPENEAAAGKRFRNDPGSRNADNGFRVVALDMPVRVSTPAPVRIVPPMNLERPQPPGPAQQVIPGELDAPTSSRHERPDQPARSRDGGIFVWLLIAGGGLVLWKVIKGVLGSLKATPLRAGEPVAAPEPQGGGMFTVRVVQDGFWIRARIAAGTNLRVRWVGATSTHSRNFAYQPGQEGHFVFTGDEPSNVTVNVDETGAGGVSETHSRILGAMDSMSPRHVDPEPPRSSGFSGFPSAY